MSFKLFTKGFTQISRKGAAANEADFAKRLLADIYAKSAKLTAAQPPLCRDFEGQPPLLRDGVFPSALVETAPALQRFAERQSASAAVLFLLFPKNLGQSPAIFGKPFSLGLRIIEIACVHPFS